MLHAVIAKCCTNISKLIYTTPQEHHLHFCILKWGGIMNAHALRQKTTVSTTGRNNACTQHCKTNQMPLGVGKCVPLPVGLQEFIVATGSNIRVSDLMQHGNNGVFTGTITKEFHWQLRRDWIFGGIIIRCNPCVYSPHLLIYSNGFCGVTPDLHQCKQNNQVKHTERSLFGSKIRA